MDISISMQLHNPYTVGKLSIRRVKICNFTRIRCNTKEKRAFKSEKMTLHDECTWSLYCGQVHTGSDRFGQVRTGVKRCFSSTVSRTLSKFGSPSKPACSFLTVPRSNLYDPPSGGNSASSRFNWCKVWTGVKCSFSLEHFQKRYVIRKLSLSRVRMWNFSSIGP